MSQNEIQKKKKNLRQSKKWKTLRHNKNVEQKGIDLITLKKLSAGCNLHHLDQRECNYDKIDDPGRFILLNKLSHKAVHWIFVYYVKDKGVLDRLKDVLDEMIEKSND